MTDKQNDYERNLALLGAHHIHDSDAYFDARPQIDSDDRRKVFEAGYERAWKAAHLSARQGEAVGWKLVPIELTPEMLEAIRKFNSKIAYLHHPDVPYEGTENGDSEEKWGSRLLAASYQAMLAASPQPTQDKDAEIARLRECLSESFKLTSKLCCMADDGSEEFLIKRNDIVDLVYEWRKNIDKQALNQGDNNG
jgi:hypothetical protein